MRTGLLVKLGILLLALALFEPTTTGVVDAWRFSRRLMPGFGGSPEISPEVERAVGVVMWALAAFFVAYLLAELRDTSRTIYAVVVIAGSALVIGYFASKLHREVTTDQLVAIGGASLGAIDGFIAWRQRKSPTKVGANPTTT